MQVPSYQDSIKGEEVKSPKVTLFSPLVIFLDMVSSPFADYVLTRVAWMVSWRMKLHVKLHGLSS